MSYILEALRKAEAERERAAGAVPGIGTQSMPQGLAGSGGSKAVPPWVWLVAGVGLTLGAVALWPSKPTESPGTVALAPATPPAPAASAVGLPGPAAALAPSAPVATSSAPAAPQVAAPAPKAPAKAVPPAPAPRIAAAAPSKTDKVAPADAAKPAPKPAPQPAPKPPPAPPKPAPPNPAPPPLPLARDLPEAMKRDLPALDVGGAVYSPQRASRLVILNGQVVREGDSLAPGLVLESIGQKAATLSLRGERFLLPYRP